MYQVLLFKFRRHLCKGSMNSNEFSVHPKRTKLSQMTNSNLIFHVVVSVSWLLKFETHPSSSALPKWPMLIINWAGFRQFDHISQAINFGCEVTYIHLTIVL